MEYCFFKQNYRPVNHKSKSLVNLKSNNISLEGRNTFKFYSFDESIDSGKDLRLES